MPNAARSVGASSPLLGETEENFEFAPLMRALHESYTVGTEPGALAEKETEPNANVLRAKAIAQSSRIAAFMRFHDPATVPFQTVQAWEGVVEEIVGDSISVRLADKTVPSLSESFAEISLSEIDEEDRHLLRPGAVFYWVVGYEQRPSGRMTTGFIRFRRSPAWTQRKIKDVEKKANDLFRRFTPSGP